MIAHPPSSFISNACPALDLLRRNTAACLCHEVDRIKPDGQWSRRFMKDGSSGRRDLIAAMVTGIRLLALVVMKQRVLALLWAIFLAGRDYDGRYPKFSQAGRSKSKLDTFGHNPTESIGAWLSPNLNLARTLADGAGN